MKRTGKKQRKQIGGKGFLGLGNLWSPADPWDAWG